MMFLRTHNWRAAEIKHSKECKNLTHWKLAECQNH